MATGSEILNYRGDAGLAAGSAGGVDGLSDYGVNAGTDPLAGVNSMIRQQADHATAWNAMKYAQAIQDRNELYKLFAGNRIDFPIDDNDRPQVQGQIDKIKRMMTDNPNLNDPNNQGMLRGEFSQLAALKAAAQGRNTDLITQRNAIATETNPKARERMQKFYDEQRKGDLNKQVQPFQQELGWDLKTLFPSVPRKTVIKKTIDPTTHIPTVETSEVTDVPAIKNLWSELAMTPGENNDRPYQAQKWHEDLLLDDRFMNPANIKLLQARVDGINTATGNERFSDPGHINYVGEVQKDPNTGEERVVLNPNVRQLGTTLHVLNEWKEPVAVVAPDKELIDAEAKMATTEGTRATTVGKVAENLHADEAWELEKRKKESDIAKDKASTDKDVQEVGGRKQLALAVGNKVKDIFSLNSKAGNFNTYGKGSDKQKNNWDTYFSPLQIGQDWTVRKMPLTGSAMQALTKGDIVNVPGGTPKLVETAPEQIYLARSPDGDPKHARLVGIYNDGGKRHAEGVSLEDAGARIISTLMKHKQEDPEYFKQLGVYQSEMADMLNTIGLPEGAAPPPAGQQGSQQGGPGAGSAADSTAISPDIPLTAADTSAGETPPPGALVVPVNGQTRWIIGNQLVNPKNPKVPITILTDAEVERAKQLAK